MERRSRNGLVILSQKCSGGLLIRRWSNASRRRAFFSLANPMRPKTAGRFPPNQSSTGATFNPWRQGITDGGSSGGAASAVASGMVPIAEATDAAGSISSPGVLLRSRWAEADARPADSQSGWRCLAWLRFAFGNTRTVRDTAAYLDAVAGGLPGDPYTPPIPDGSWSELARREPKKLRNRVQRRPAG